MNYHPDEFVRAAEPFALFLMFFMPKMFINDNQLRAEFLSLAAYLSFCRIGMTSEMQAVANTMIRNVMTRVFRDQQCNEPFIRQTVRHASSET